LVRLIGWTVLIVLFGGIVASVIGSALGIINLPFFNFAKKVDLNYGVINKTYDTDYCLQNYEWFKQTEQGIIGMEDKLANQKRALSSFESSAGPRKNWTFEDKTLYAELTSRVTALENLRVSMVNEYNAKTQSLNRVACKELPLFIKP
jgi:hypothetical protein